MAISRFFLPVLLLFLSIPCVTALGADVPEAFPGALGFGRYATGGRGGQVYHVTTLNDSGPGSFRDAVSQPKRTVVFDVAGVIKISSKVQVASDITIAGQSAPGEGVVVYGDGVTFSGSRNVIVRYMRFRGSIGMSRGSCTLIADDAQRMIFDHVSVQWGRWDNLHIQNSKDITMQHCIIGEAIEPQRFGALLERPDNLSFYYCLWINNQSRNPKAKARMEFVNNVLYNWGSNGFVGGHSAAAHYQDLVGNYFIAGPSSTGSYASQFSETDHVYHTGNYLDMNKNGMLDGVLIPDADTLARGATFMTVPAVFDPARTRVLPASDAYDLVLREAGASKVRDAVDQRAVAHLGSLGFQGGIIMQESEVGGQPELQGGRVEADADRDGIPAAWELKAGLSDQDPRDAARVAASGYTFLEEYLNSGL